MRSGFIGALLDFSFSQSITVTLIKILSGLLLLASCIVALATLVSVWGAIGGAGGMLVGVIGGVVNLALFVIISRVYCELLIVLFRVADNTGELVRLTRENTQGH